MKIDALTMIGGMPIELDCGVKIYQPRLSAIRDIGYAQYNAYVNLLMVDTHTLLETLGLSDNGELATLHPMCLVLLLPGLAETLLEGLSFFLHQTVEKNSDGGLICQDGAIISTDAFYEIRNAIARVCCIESTEDEAPPKGSAKAMAIYKKIQEGRKRKRETKKKQPQDMEINNLISAVSARSATYNLLNIWDLTIWQLYDQFARMSVNEQYDVWAQKWATWGQDDYDFSLWYKNSQSE